jgi:chromosome segregation ATPase
MGADRAQTEHGPNKRRVTVAEAAEILGITAEAVRTRIKRNKLESVKEPPDRTGTVYVLLQADQTGPNIDPTSQVQDQTIDQTEQRAELVEALRDQVEALREQAAYLQGVIATRDRELEQRAEEIRRRDAALEREQQLTAMFATRLGELEAPTVEATETREAPEGTGPIEDSTPTSEGPHEGAQAPERRSWWRRVFGG